MEDLTLWVWKFEIRVTFSSIFSKRLIRVYNSTSSYHLNHLYHKKIIWSRWQQLFWDKSYGMKKLLILILLWFWEFSYYSTLYNTFHISNIYTTKRTQQKFIWVSSVQSVSLCSRMRGPVIRVNLQTETQRQKYKPRKRRDLALCHPP